MNSHLKSFNESAVCEIKLSYSNPLLLKNQVITDSTSAYNLLKIIWSDDIELQEEFNVIYLDVGARVLGYQTISTGGFSSVIVDVKKILVSALLLKSSAIILAHNHPSQNLRPSVQDKALTTKLVEAAKTVELTIFDHIIITSQNGFYSFADEGNLETPF